MQDADDGTSFDYQNGTMDWNSGAAWYDTRFIYPYNRRYSIGHTEPSLPEFRHGRHVRHFGAANE